MLRADSDAEFSRRDPFPLYFIIERGSVCGGLCHPYLIQPLFKTKIVCVRCNILLNLIKNYEIKLFTFELSRLGRNAKRAPFWKPVKTRYSPFVRKVCVHSFQFMDGNLVPKNEDKGPHDRKTLRDKQFSVFSMTSWCQETKWVVHTFFRDFQNSAAFIPKTGTNVIYFLTKLTRTFCLSSELPLN